MMLRDLVKFAKKKGYNDAKIEAGGIKVGGVLYAPDMLDELPENIRPEKVRIRSTKNKGLAFFSEWAYLSNMHRAPFMYDGKRFTSAEQCFQVEKAAFHKRWTTANKIIVTDDAYKCKKEGDKVETNNEWLGAREAVMKNVVRQKFVQNEVLLKKLVDTGKARLYEAVAGGSIWSINSSFYAKATYDETATGPNALGRILEDLRGEFTVNNGGGK